MASNLIKTLRKGLSLLQSKRAYLCHLEPRLLRLLDADMAFLAANPDLFQPLTPLPIPAPGKGPLLVLGAHPDDETLGAGGSLLLARDKGLSITTAFLTDGRPSGRDSGGREEGETRRAEALAAGEILGAEVLFFKSPVRSLARDKGLAREAVRWLRDILIRIKPRTILCPFPLEAHSDHRLVAWALAEALFGESLTGRADEPIIWAYEVASLCPANVVVEITGVEEEKASLIGVYGSQTAAFGYANVVRGLNRYHSRHLGGKGAAEAFLRIPAESFGRLVAGLSEEQLFKDE